MSNAGKLVKNLVKTKKESVMGKLGDSPYEDPMEPWSAKYAQPVKEESLNEDSLLMKYIRSLGFNPEFMSFAQRSSYARSNAFKRFKTGHTFDAEKQNLKKEEVEQIDEAGTGLLMSFIKSKGLSPLTMDGNQKKAYSRSSEFRIFKMRHMKETSGMGERGDDWNEEKKQVKEEADAKDVVSMDIPLLIRVLEYAREDAKTDMDLHKVVENLINMRGKGVLSMDMYNKIIAIKEEIESIDEADSGRPYMTVGGVRKREDDEGYGKQKVTGKTTTSHFVHINGKHWKTFDTVADANRAKDSVKKKYPDKKVHVQTKTFYEEVKQIDELSSDTLKSYVSKVATGPSRGMTQKGTLKSIKAIGGVTKAIRKQYEKPITELKNQNDNMEIDDRITREDLRKWFSKTDPEGDWKRINSKGEVAGPCAREPGEPKPKCMSKEKRAELSKSERAAAVATKRKHDPVADRAGKGGKPINVSNYGKGKLSEEEVDEACWDTHKQVGTKMKGGKVVPNCVPKNEEVEKIDEKNKPTNPALWSRAKSMARSKFDVYPSAYANGWASKWYKSKGGGWKSVSEDVVQEGIGGIEDSPMSATNSVKAMESEQRKKNMKSARIIKSIYKKKGKNESMYDWEKDDKGGKTPTAKITLQGGTTMTGKPRDTVEIEPVLKTRPNSQKQ